jgi:hypothetical protein
VPALRIPLLLALLAHASLVVAGVMSAPAWVPIVESVAACLIGLRHLRAVDADGARAREAASAPPPLPARVAGGVGRSSGPSVGS